MVVPDPPLALETRARRSIPNEVRPERPEAALKASVQLFKQLFPDAVLRSITAVYNCVGMVVANRRTWVDPADLLRILSEDGYRQLAGEMEVELGDVVVYRDRSGEVCHVATVVAKKLIVPGSSQDVLKILSKWGADGEYFHDLTRLPSLLGRPAEFWTDRREI